jgi:hypothetical protein
MTEGSMQDGAHVTAAMIVMIEELTILVSNFLVPQENATIVYVFSHHYNSSTSLFLLHMKVSEQCFVPARNRR